MEFDQDGLHVEIIFFTAAGDITEERNEAVRAIAHYTDDEGVLVRHDYISLDNQQKGA